ncbi:GNAT family N-acetyltransferase [Bacillus sp. KH172YL63]|uniref:GNAT family N-acetyltransferase n=1 Tax=Bacillus sp. KH172YL63 TaxID=2709784 RepID=UPI0013E4B7B3|nr:GNAT family N-acetyltransferase [Bacillus sp. KH172YL63]BCB03673.1 alanine acetyltransferase [Bacillus sp. KH172YL63]
MKIAETERLMLRWVETDDAGFILTLLNEPGWLKYIGDKGIRTLEDAEKYILNGPKAMYQREGFGLFLVERKVDYVPIGLCGLIKRDGLEDVDIGFAFLEARQSQGFAYEAALAVISFSKDKGLNRLVAITTKDNTASSNLLEKLGMKHEGYVVLPHDCEELKKYGMDL